MGSPSRVLLLAACLAACLPAVQLRRSNRSTRRTPTRQPGKSLTLYGPFFASHEGNHNKRTQAALGSWAALVPQSNIILFTEVQAPCDWLQSVRFDLVRCLLSCKHPAIPRMDMGCITATAAALATTSHLALVNSDIVLLPNFVQAFQNVAAQTGAVGEFLIIGRRFNVAATRALDDAAVGWPFGLLESPGQLDGRCAVDYFVHSKQLWSHITMPSFLAGVWLWDRWWVAQANMHPNVTTVDASLTVTAFHLQSEMGKGDTTRHQDRPFAMYNERIVNNSRWKNLIDEGRKSHHRRENASSRCTYASISIHGTHLLSDTQAQPTRPMCFFFQAAD